MEGNCVVKSDTHETVKCHQTHAEAVAHLAALEINVMGADKKEVSDWGLEPDQASSTGTLRTLMVGKLHEVMTQVSDQLTQRGYLSQEQNYELTRLKGDLLKIFNMQVPADLADIAISPLDLTGIANKEFALAEIESSFAVKETKQGNHRWTMFTSSSFKDRDGETISLAAHEKDTDLMWESKEFGTLDWFHLHPLVWSKTKGVDELPKSVQEHGLIVGDCDYSAMHGRIRIESGTFRSKEIGQALAKDANNLSASLMYLYPKNEPDAQGVYHNILTVSRAVMPKQAVSNYASHQSSLTVQEH